jgi:hypothetical protein
MGRAGERVRRPAAAAHALAALLTPCLPLLRPPPQKYTSQVRLGEKEALDGFLGWLEARQAALPTLEYYQERRLKRLGLMDEEGRTTYDSFFRVRAGGGPVGWARAGGAGVAACGCEGRRAPRSGAPPFLHPAPPKQDGIA